MPDDLVLLTADLYGFVEATESLQVGDRPAAVEGLKARAQELSERFAALRDRASREVRGVVERASADLRAMAAVLGDARRHPELHKAWKALGVSYEALVQHIRARGIAVPSTVHLGHVKPKNYYRNLFHVSNGLIGVILYSLGVDRWILVGVAGSIFVAFMALDLIRRFYPPANALLVDLIFGKISRPVDAHSTPSAVWFAGALALGSAVLPQHAVCTGVLILAFADPAAALIGKTLGGPKLYRDRTWAGTLGFLVTALIVSSIYLGLMGPGLGALAVLGIAAAASTAGAVAELAGTHVDDNLTISLLSGGVAALLL